MLVVHGIWTYGALWLWAEDSGLPSGSAPQADPPSRAERAERRSRAPRPHPFACDASQCADALAGLAALAGSALAATAVAGPALAGPALAGPAGPAGMADPAAMGGPAGMADPTAMAGPVADLARKAVEDELTLFLPSTPAGPLASPDLLRPVPSDAADGRRADGRRPVLAAWRIPALTFEPAAALSLLTVLDQPALSEPVTDLALGEPVLGERARGDAASGEPGQLTVAGSVPYLAALARLADDLVSRGRVLPQLIEESDGYEARWRPVLAGTDAQRAAELAAAMPPLGRATSRAGEPPARLVTEALDCLADAAARARLDGLPLRPAPGRGRTGPKVADRWLMALTAADARLGELTPAQEAEAAELGARLSAWLATAQIPAGPVRTCFRLAEPELATQPPDDGDQPASADQPVGGGEPPVAASRPAAPSRPWPPLGTVQVSRKTRYGGWSSRCSPPTTPA